MSLSLSHALMLLLGVVAILYGVYVVVFFVRGKLAKRESELVAQFDQASDTTLVDVTLHTQEYERQRELAEGIREHLREEKRERLRKAEEGRMHEGVGVFPVHESRGERLRREHVNSGEKETHYAQPGEKRGEPRHPGPGKHPPR